MNIGEKASIDASRRSMNLLTKRGSWHPAPIDPKAPRLVTFSAGKFEIKGEQVGREVKFSIAFDGNTALNGFARINWLTEDASIEIVECKMSEAAYAELKSIYASELPGSLAG